MNIEKIRKSSAVAEWVKMLNELKGVSADLYDEEDDKTIILGEVAKSLEGHRSETGYINHEWDYLAFGFDADDQAEFGNNIKGTWLEVLFEIKQHVFANLILPDNPTPPNFEY